MIMMKRRKFSELYNQNTNTKKRRRRLKQIKHVRSISKFRPLSWYPSIVVLPRNMRLVLIPFQFVGLSRCIQMLINPANVCFASLLENLKRNAFGYGGRMTCDKPRMRTSHLKVLEPQITVTSEARTISWKVHPLLNHGRSVMSVRSIAEKSKSFVQADFSSTKPNKPHSSPENDAHVS